MLLEMEQAKSLSFLADFEDRAVSEYDILDKITEHLTNTVVPAKTTIDASFIKTPFREAQNHGD